MCTSITGASKVLSASKIATEVWVKAAGLMTMPLAVSRASDPVDDLVLTVRLVEAQVQAEFAGERAARRLHVGEGLAAVDVRLALAEQVQVRAVQDVDQTTHGRASGNAQ